MEVFDLYDKDFNKLDKTMIRGTKNNKGEFHLVVHIWIRNDNGEYLIQQRNKLTDKVPFQWFCTGGAVTTGETSLDTAQRETFEELGIMIALDKFRKIKRYFVEDEHANFILDVYLVEENVLLKDLTIDTVEVRDTKYATIPEIRQMIKDNEFWDLERQEVRKGYLNLLEKS